MGSNRVSFRDQTAFDARSRYLKYMAFMSVAFSTVAVTACLITFPLMFHLVHSAQTAAEEDLSYCMLTSRNLWHEMVDIESDDRSSADPVQVARAFGNLKAVDPTAKPSLVLSKRQTSGMECCTCHQGAAGPQGAPGADGQSGNPGLDGVPGRIGRPAADASASLTLPPQCPCEAPVGTPGPPGPKGQQGSPGNGGQNGLAGRDGTPGKSGAKGPLGPPGRAGGPGQRGSPGRQTTSPGTPGQPGTPGTPGKRGLPGQAGQNGFDGKPGVPGALGNKGSRGIDGRSGNPGQPGGVGSVGPLGSCTHCPTARLAPGY